MLSWNSPLATDLYQLTMLQAYYLEGMDQTASFELFVRKLPPNRNFLLAMGLEQALQYLKDLRFSEEDCAWLESTGIFRPEFLDSLLGFRFEGDVDAMPEGTPFFPDEPIVRVTAPLPQAQMVETRLINLLQFETMIASKAVRSVIASAGRLLVDFGMRRAHGAEAALLASRASYVAGFEGSSNLLAGRTFGIPVFGTMAHSYVMAHDDEAEAFARFSATLPPERLVLLVDTYDTLAAVDKIVELARAVSGRSIRPRWIRLDSGDLGELAASARQRLDSGGLSECRIFASGDLDEYAIADLVANHTPIDGFGVGTRLVTSADAPFLNCAYKLQEYAGKPRRKRSHGKVTWPGCRQVFRRYDDGGLLASDRVALVGEPADGEALLLPVMRGGKVLSVDPSPTESARRQVTRQIELLPRPMLALRSAASCPVEISQALSDLAHTLDHI
jgi:nicotinate phosphoribosyltransferase